MPRAGDTEGAILLFLTEQDGATKRTDNIHVKEIQKHGKSNNNLKVSNRKY